MFEITDQQLLDIAKDYCVDIDKVNRYKELLLGSQLISDEEKFCAVLSSAVDISNPPVTPEGLELPPEMEKPLTEREILRKALMNVYDSEDPELIDADVEAMIQAMKKR